MILLFFLVSQVFAGIDAEMTQGHLSREKLTLETKIIRNKTVYIFATNSDVEGSHIRAVPEEHYRKTLKELNGWLKVFYKKTPMLGLACEDFLDIKHKEVNDSFCITTLDKKDRAEFNRWKTQVFKGY